MTIIMWLFGCLVTAVGIHNENDFMLVIANVWFVGSIIVGRLPR